MATSMLLLGLLGVSTSALPSAPMPAAGCIAHDPSDRALCIGAEKPIDPNRLAAAPLPGVNMKMDAMRLDPRPCRLIGSICPVGKRPLFRSDETGWLNFRPVLPRFLR